ncbi:MAG: hypothetical protein ACLFSR_09005 [Halomonas sp.]
MRVKAGDFKGSDVDGEDLAPALLLAGPLWMLASDEVEMEGG